MIVAVAAAASVSPGPISFFQEQRDHGSRQPLCMDRDSDSLGKAAAMTGRHVDRGIHTLVGTPSSILGCTTTMRAESSEWSVRGANAAC